MEILLAEHMGFCGGVDRAIRMTEAALAGTEISDDRGISDDRRMAFGNEALAGSGAFAEIEAPAEMEMCSAGIGKADMVWSVGPIIHNEIVMKGLRAKGLRIADSLNDIPDGATVVVRSHGEGPEFFKEAAAKGVRVVDATCPKVGRIHELVRAADKRGELVVVAGDEAHPEVRAVRAWGGGTRASVVCSLASLEKLIDELFKTGEPLFLVSQTTFNKEEFERIADRFRDLSENEYPVPVNINNMICDATALRQDACRRLAEQSDCVIVVGDKHSSNTKKLYEIAKSNGRKRAFFIENKDEISLKQLCECDKLGVTAGASTPKHIVEEVISSMSEFRSDNYETNPMHEFMDEIDRSTRLPRNGDIVTGEVIQVTDNDVTVNLGCKKDGVIPKTEIGLEEGQTLQDVFKEGDEVQAKVMKNDDGEGNILLSKKRVVVSEHWETITKAYDEKTPIEVKVIREVTGGVIAMFNEVGGFIPLSQLSDRYIENAEEFVGQTLPAKVIRLDQKRNKVVFSHKAVLNEERQKRMQEIWDQLSVGDIIDGRVMRFTDYGAFVDIGGVDGLLHISEISWGKLRHPADLLELNQRIKVKILSMNKEKEKISLGYKQNQPEPWSIINEKYHIGQVIHGKAVQIKDYGVFVEIEPGLDGLVHISEIAFRRVTEISEELEVGQEVSAKILEIDSVRKRISLSIKETMDKPSDEEIAAAAAAQEAPAEQAADAEAPVEQADILQDEASEAAADAEAVEEAAVATDAETSIDETPAEEAAVEDKAAEDEIPAEEVPAVEAAEEPASDPEASIEEAESKDAEATIEETAAEEAEAAIDEEAEAADNTSEQEEVADEEAADSGELDA